MLVLLLKPLRLLSLQDTCELVVVCWCWGAATFGYITAIFHWLTLDITHTLHETELARAEKRRRGAADSAIMLVLCSPLLCRHNVTQVTLFPHKTPPKLQASLSLEPFTTLFWLKTGFTLLIVSQCSVMIIGQGWNSWVCLEKGLIWA